MRRSKALIIGISYKTSKTPSSDGWDVLDGTLQDAKRMKTFVKEKLGYKHVVAITDKKDSRKVSRCNILQRLNWLVEGARDGDILFLHYAGHGGQRPTRNNTEQDGLDEAIIPADCPYPARRDSVGTIPDCPLDCSCGSANPQCWKPAYVGMIHDNELRDILVKNLPKGVRLVTLFDTCHSGSILDLQYHFLPCGAVVPRDMTQGPTRIRTEQIQSARPQPRPQSRFEKFRDLFGQKSSTRGLGAVVGTSSAIGFGHVMPVASPDDHMYAMRNKLQHDVATSYSLSEALGASTGMGFGHSIPATSPQMVDYHMHVMRNKSQQDLEVSCPLGEITFGYGITTKYLRMVDDYLHAMRDDDERGVAVSLSACIDPDTVFELDDGKGMLTTFFIQLLEEHEFQIPVGLLLDKMYPLFHSEWESKWSEKMENSPCPVVCSNQKLDLNSIFLV